MLRQVINSLSYYAGHSEESFWEKISSENIEEFLSDYTLPIEILKINTDDYALLKRIITEDVIKTDDDSGSLLGATEVDIVSDILIFTHLYGSFVNSNVAVH